MMPPQPAGAIGVGLARRYADLVAKWRGASADEAAQLLADLGPMEVRYLLGVAIGVHLAVTDPEQPWNPLEGL